MYHAQRHANKVMLFIVLVLCAFAAIATGQGHFVPIPEAAPVADQGAMAFIMANKESMFAILGAAMVLGGLIVKLTPTKVDDKWWSKITGLVSNITPAKK